MDHLALPSRPTTLPPRVPYVCSETYDDHHDFTSYPSRFLARKRQNGVDPPAFEWVKTVLPSAGQLPFWWIQMQQPSPDDELADFFQSWIFFGLLHRMLAPHGLFEAADYTDTDDDGIYVHTRHLSERLDTWVEMARDFDETVKIHRKLELTKCLQIASHAMRCLLPLNGQPELGHPNFDRAIQTSLASICETISTVGEMVLDVLPDEDWLRFDMFATFNNADRTRMKRNGWCASSIAAAEKDFSSVAGSFYVQHMRQPSLGIDHRYCTISGCKRLQIDPQTYVSRHVDDNCRCDFLGPDPNEIARCLDNGTFPALRIDGNNIEDVSLHVEEYKPDIAYVALSHVWVDGLGNPSANALARCQLLRFQSLLNGLQGRTFAWTVNAEERVETRKLYLWCDSLVCPNAESLPIELDVDETDLQHFSQQPHVLRSKQLKTAAIAQLRSVYEKAAYVLVLDRGLETLSFSSINTIEATISVLTSRWMQRLWTYQEASLPSKLLIKFSDRIIDFRDLAQGMKDLYTTNPVLRSLTRDVAGSCMSLRSLQYLRDQGGPDLLRYQISIRHRRVSYQSDEPICAASILGLDTGRVHAASGYAARMEVFWQLLAVSERGVPDDIIFHEFPRLARPGFRWAPSTFQQDFPQQLKFLTNPPEARRATLEISGLRVSRPGWRFRIASPPWGTSSNEDWQKVAGDLTLLHVRDVSGKWFSISSTERTDANPKESVWEFCRKAKEWYIILDTSPGIENGRKGIVGRMEISANGDEVFVSEMFVMLRPLQPYWATIMDAAGHHAVALRQHHSFRLWQLCRVSDDLLASFLSIWTPIHVLSSTNGWSSRFHVRPFVQEYARLGQIAAQTEEVANMIRVTSASLPAGESMSISGHIGLHFMGKFATVVEEFDVSHEWIVS